MSHHKNELPWQVLALRYGINLIESLMTLGIEISVKKDIEKINIEPLIKK